MTVHHKVKGFSFNIKKYSKIEKSINKCLRLRNQNIKQKQDEALEFIKESKLTFDIKKRHFFNEADMLEEMITVYEKYLQENAGKLPPKELNV